MLQFSFDHNLVAFRNGVQNAIRAFATQRQPLEKIKRRQNDVWMQNFAGGGGRYGGWAGLTSYTMRERGRLGYGPGPTLVRSGRLMGWMQRENKAAKVAADSLLWSFHGSGAKDGSYAVFHSEGFYSTLFQRPVAARKIWDINADDEAMMEEEINHWVDDVVARYF
jgi:hypothetical protein